MYFGPQQEAHSINLVQGHIRSRYSCAMYRVDELLKQCADITLGEGNNSLPEFDSWHIRRHMGWAIQCMKSNAKQHKGIVLPNFARLSFQGVEEAEVYHGN